MGKFGAIFSALFSPPEIDLPAPPPPPPTRGDPEIEAARKKQQQAEKRRKGRAATILTSGRGVEDELGASVDQPRAARLLGG